MLRLAKIPGNSLVVSGHALGREQYGWPCNRSNEVIVKSETGSKRIKIVEDYKFWCSGSSRNRIKIRILYIKCSFGLNLIIIIQAEQPSTSQFHTGWIRIVNREKCAQSAQLSIIHIKIK